ncbi:MAG: AglZ/HisF2 family acetamidino modification protein [Bdellovibrionaceae bacterium]|nr:AglZ/HisF2 family acetamidino modification protein [Pseudobdellovibrionaceae bacterium]
MIRRARIIPILLLRGDGLVKTQGFQKSVYVGDPINAAKIFNDSEVDELIVLDISPEAAEKGPNFEKLGELATECFMPVCYGGGVRSLWQVERLFALGFEKVAFNTALVKTPALVGEASRVFGASSIVASIDVRRKMFGRLEVMTAGGREATGLDPVAHARQAVERGAGEILLTSIDQEGGRKGYDLKLVQAVRAAVEVPIVAHGGAGRLEDMRDAITAGASAAAAGSLFVFHGRLNGVLINYPTQADLRRLLHA